MSAIIARLGATASTPECAPVGLLVSFQNSRGTRLIGQLLVPATESRLPVVVFAHGSGSGRHSPHNRLMAETLNKLGIGAFLFDFTGYDDSEGRRRDCTLAQQTDDLAAAADVLATFDEVDSHRVGMIGVSSGAPSALQAAARDARIRALVLWSATLTGFEDTLPRVTTPTLLVLGEADGPIHAINEILLERLGGPRHLETIPSDLFEDPEAIVAASNLMAEWFGRHLG